MADSFSLMRDVQGRLVLGRAGMEDVVDVRIRRAFPWSCPTRHVSIRTKDGKELLMIDDVSELPEALRTIVLGDLSSMSLIPLIQRVMKVDVRFGFQQWTVATDRGGGVPGAGTGRHPLHAGRAVYREGRGWKSVRASAAGFAG